MCVEYETLFINNHIKTKGRIFYDKNDQKYSLPIIINEIIIETDGFEFLTIDLSENYSKEQLKIFDYDLEKRYYKLKNYNLITTIPINIIEKNSGKQFSENIFIEMINKENSIIRRIKIFDKEIIVNEYDLLGAFDKLYESIDEKYILKICAFCKKSSWNPYGGSDFLNHLCFKEFVGEYYKINRNDKMDIVKFMNKNDWKYKNTYLTHFCNEYEKR